MPATLLKLLDVHKSFGPVQALRGVGLTVERGQIHGVIGENGAGKSTLMKILSGVYAPDSGRILLDGEPFEPRSPLEGRTAGISMIYQELVLAPHLSVEENITLGIESSRRGWIASRRNDVAAALETLGQTDLDLRERVGDLSIGKQQLVEIARALVADARIVVMDEPTSSLSSEDTEALFGAIRRLAADEVAVIYISHFLEEVQEVCDAYTVIRDGRTVATGRVEDATIPVLIEHMVGRPVEKLYPPGGHAPGRAVLSVEDLSGRGDDRTLISAGFTLRTGETLGIFGLVGAGRSEMVRSLFGLYPAGAGRVEIRNHPEVSATWITPPRALRLGINLLTENRKEEGLALGLSLLANLTLSTLGRYVRWGVINLRKERSDGHGWIDRLRVKCHDIDQPAATLSGGNQQKICIARLLHQDSDILFLDEPTRGLDIGSKAEIYELIRELASRGKSLVVVSSYLPELMGICDTLAVMHRGTLSEVRPVSDWSRRAAMQFATSGRQTPAGAA